MRKILRLLILVLMVAYGGGKSWGDTVKFRAGNNDNSEKKEINPPTDDNRTIAKNEFILTVDGNSNFSADHGSLGADCWFIEKDCNFTIKSTHKMVHIFISFSRKDWLITEHHGGERFELVSGGGTWTPCKEVGGDIYIPFVGTKHVTFGYRNGYWHNDSGSTEVKFKAKDDRADILWIKIWYDASTSDDGNTTTGNIKINDSTSKDDVWFKEDAYNIKVSTTSKYYNSFTWSINGTNQNKLTADLTKTSTVTVVGTKTVGAQDDDSDMKDTNDDSSITTYDTFTKNYYQYWNVSTSSGKHSDNKYYATFCHKNIMKVPDNCSAWTYTKSGNKMIPSKEYGANSYIPGGTPVIVCSSISQSTLRFVNPYNNIASTSTDNNKAEEFMGNDSNSPIHNSNTNYNYYYLMKDPKGGLNFLRYSTNTCPGHACYLQLLASSALAKGFVFQFPDDDETTGISGIIAEYPAFDEKMPMYNAVGQRVGSDYKGIVIQKGRKFIRR